MLIFIYTKNQNKHNFNNLFRKVGNRIRSYNKYISIIPIRLVIRFRQLKEFVGIKGYKFITRSLATKLQTLAQL